MVARAWDGEAAERPVPITDCPSACRRRQNWRTALGGASILCLPCAVGRECGSDPHRRAASRLYRNQSRTPRRTLRLFQNLLRFAEFQRSLGPTLGRFRSGGAFAVGGDDRAGAAGGRGGAPEASGGWPRAGATGKDLRRQALRKAALRGAIGIPLGWSLALASRHVIQSLMYGVNATDPWMLVAASNFAALVVLAAALRPAHTAARVDPVVALHYE